MGGDLVREILLNKDQFGADRILCHRQDLQPSLQSAAVSPDLPGNPAVIRTSSQVVDVDCEEGIVTLESGEKVRGDVIIGTDGIHSAGEAGNLSAPKKLLDPRDPSTTMLIGHDRRVMMGPGRAAKMYGIVTLVPDEKLAETSSSESWVEPGSIEKLRSAYADFPDWLHEIFMATPDIALWQLRDRWEEQRNQVGSGAVYEVQL
ncbi:hypothetical protein B0T10DRAFT_586097 [Thelonectria olida]|uniref:FAD-binding domain-containing protein n=1 Tax=Thelonectria olida TaxID=1576542 RepID=A0A9P8VT90_9HYPO|nr:hypothetical protein B0T10DRAFT_586097 [Thelonectria olida]